MHQKAPYFLSHYFPESVCTAIYAVGYSLFYYLLVLEEDGQIVSLSDSSMEHVCGCFAMLTVRVVVLEYSQLYTYNDNL